MAENARLEKFQEMASVSSGRRFVFVSPLKLLDLLLLKNQTESSYYSEAKSFLSVCACDLSNSAPQSLFFHFCINSCSN